MTGKVKSALALGDCLRQRRDRKKFPAGEPAHYDIRLQAWSSLQLQFSSSSTLPLSPSSWLQEHGPFRQIAKTMLQKPAFVPAPLLSFLITVLFRSFFFFFFLLPAVRDHWDCPAFSFPRSQLQITLIKDVEAEGGSGGGWGQGGGGQVWLQFQILLDFLFLRKQGLGKRRACFTFFSRFFFFPDLRKLVRLVSKNGSVNEM